MDAYDQTHFLRLTRRSLSEQDEQILELVSRGVRQRIIAERFGVSQQAISRRIHRIRTRVFAAKDAGYKRAA